MSEIEKKEEWYLNIDYREAKEIIRNKLQGMTQNFIGIGFYLRRIKETEGFRKDGYASVYEFAEDQYGIKRSTAIRWMQMNEKFSQGGYSPFLDSGYKDFGKSQLQEMLYLDSEQLEEVTPEMTVREIREIRTPDPEPEEQLPGQMSVEDFPEVLPEQEEQQTEETKVELQKPTEEVWEYLNAFARGFIKLRKNWFLENYQNRVMDVTTSPILIRQEFCEGRSRTHYFEIREKSAFINLFDDYIQVFSVNCDYLGDYDWFYLAAAIQSMWNVVAIEEAQQKNEEEQSSEEVCDVAQSENTDCKPEQSSCPPGQTSCPRENWGTSDEDQLQGWRECAACWNHYKKLHEHDEEIPKEENVGIEIPQDIVEEENKPVEDYQEILEENEPVIVEQSEGIAIVDVPSEPELYEEVSEKTDIDIAREENQKAQMYLEMLIEEFSQNDIRVRKQKILVAALAGYIHDLDMVLNPPEEPEQPELSKLKNNDQRKEWLNNYKEWGLWYRDEKLDVNHYKYDFADGSRLVVDEYPQREMYWSNELRDEHHFHLLEKNKQKYSTKKTYDKPYIHETDSETHLVEFLKNLQKGEK